MAIRKSLAVLSIGWAVLLSACVQPTTAESAELTTYRSFSQAASGGWLSERDATSVPASEYSEPSLVLRCEPGAGSGSALGSLTISEAGGYAQEYVVLHAAHLNWFGDAQPTVMVLCASGLDDRSNPQGELMTLYWTPVTFGERLNVSHNVGHGDDQAVVMAGESSTLTYLRREPR
jgi:hypothetical protein